MIVVRGKGDLWNPVTLTPTVPQLRLRPTMTTERKSARKRACPDENLDTLALASPRKRQATGSGKSSTTNTSSENTTPDPHIVQSPYFSPPKKAHDNARKKRLLAASRGLLNDNSPFVKRLSATASPAEPTEITERDRLNVAETTAAITEHLVSELSKSKARRRKTRRNPEHAAPEEPSELFAATANLTALEKQVRVCFVCACSQPQTCRDRY